jgi:hypothetical protein
MRETVWGLPGNHNENEAEERKDSMKTKPQEPWEQLGITEAEFREREERVKELTAKPATGTWASPSATAAAHPVPAIEASLNRLTASWAALTASQPEYQAPDPTDPPAPPAQLPSTSTRSRKPRSDKGEKRPQKATSAAPVSVFGDKAQQQAMKLTERILKLGAEIRAKNDEFDAAVAEFNRITDTLK